MKLASAVPRVFPVLQYLGARLTSLWGGPYQKDENMHAYPIRCDISSPNIAPSLNYSFNILHRIENLKRSTSEWVWSSDCSVDFYIQKGIFNLMTSQKYLFPTFWLIRSFLANLFNLATASIFPRPTAVLIHNLNTFMVGDLAQGYLFTRSKDQNWRYWAKARQNVVMIGINKMVADRDGWSGLIQCCILMTSPWSNIYFSW